MTHRASAPHSASIVQLKGMHDEALAGKLKGLRSSRLSKGYRVIYRVEKTAVYVQVLDINAHDYRR